MRRTPLDNTDATGIIGLRSLCPMPLGFFAQQCAEATLRPRRVTSVAYSRTGDELLVNFSGDTMCLYDLTVSNVVIVLFHKARTGKRGFRAQGTNRATARTSHTRATTAYNLQWQSLERYWTRECHRERGLHYAHMLAQNAAKLQPSTTGEGDERRLPEDHAISIDNLIANLLIARRILTQGMHFECEISLSSFATACRTS